MNRRLIVAGLMSLIVWGGMCAQAYTIARISEHNIHINREKLEGKLYRHAVARCAVLGLMGAGVLAWFLYNPTQSAVIVDSPVVSASTVPTLSCEDRMIRLENRVTVQERAGATIIADMSISPLNPYSWLHPWGLIKKVVSSMIVSGVASGGLTFLQKHFGRLFHSNSLAWFMGQTDAIEQDLKEFHYYGNMLETNYLLSEDDSHYCKYQMVQVSDRLVQQMENVIAFMRYKVEKFAPQASQEGKMAGDDIAALIRQTNKFAADVEQALSEYKGSVQEGAQAKFARLQLDFDRQLGYSLRSFNLTCKKAEAAV